MNIDEVKERKKRLETLIGDEIMEFERATGMRVADIDFTRFTSIDRLSGEGGYVTARVEL